MMSASGMKKCVVCDVKLTSENDATFDGNPLCKKCDAELSATPKKEIKKAIKVVKKRIEAKKTTKSEPKKNQDEYELVKSKDKDAKIIYVSDEPKDFLAEGELILADIESDKKHIQTYEERIKKLKQKLENANAMLGQSMTNLKQHNSDLRFYKLLTDGCFKDKKIQRIGVSNIGTPHAKINGEWFICQESLKTKKNGDKEFAHDGKQNLVKVQKFTEQWAKTEQVYPEVD